MALFESYERRIDKISGVLAQYGIGSVEECREICRAKGVDPYEIVKSIQPICFECNGDFRHGTGWEYNGDAVLYGSNCT